MKPLTTCGSVGSNPTWESSLVVLDVGESESSIKLSFL